MANVNYQRGLKYLTKINSIQKWKSHRLKKNIKRGNFIAYERSGVFLTMAIRSADVEMLSSWKKGGGVTLMCSEPQT